MSKNLTVDQRHETKRVLDKLDEPIKSNMWRNLYFNKDGRSSLGLSIFPHEELALAAYQEYLKNLKITKRFKDINGHIYPSIMHSHAIQIQWKE
jgi:hypothetical protein